MKRRHATKLNHFTWNKFLHHTGNVKIVCCLAGSLFWYCSSCGRGRTTLITALTWTPALTISHQHAPSGCRRCRRTGETLQTLKTDQNRQNRCWNRTNYNIQRALRLFGMFVIFDTRPGNKAFQKNVIQIAKETFSIWISKRAWARYFWFKCKPLSYPEKAKYIQYWYHRESS